MKTQQEVLRMALVHVLGTVPAKGEASKLAFTPEVREAVAAFMMPLLGVEWEIKSDRTKARAKDYITGMQNTDLMQNWTFTPKTKEEKAAKTAAPASSAPKLSVEEIIKMKEAGFSVEDIKVLLG